MRVRVSVRERVRVRARVSVSGRTLVTAVFPVTKDLIRIMQ